MPRTALIVLAAALTASAAFAQENAARPDPSKAAASITVNTAPIVHEIELNAPIEKVWEVFTTPEGWKLWGVAKAEIDLRVGGLIRTHYSPKGELVDDGAIHNQIIAYEPGRVFAWRIAKPPKNLPYQNAVKDVWSVATLTDLGDGRTRLRLAMCGSTADNESQKMRAFFDQGNAWSLKKMKDNLEKSLATTPAANAAVPAATPAKQATPANPLDPIILETTVKATPREVWECWTTSKGMESFLTRANIDLRIGGPFEIYFGGDDVPAGQRGSEGCTILSYEPEKMLSFTWNAPPKFGDLRARHTWVVLIIEPHGPHGSKVTLKHYGFAEQNAATSGHDADWKSLREYFANAWPTVLTALRQKYEPK